MDNVWERMDKLADKLSKSSALIAGLIGMGLLRGMLSWVLASGRAAGTTGLLPVDPHFAVSIGQLVGFIGVALRAQRSGGMARSGKSLLFSVFLLLFGAALIACSQSIAGISTVGFVGCLAAGFGYASSLLLWLEWCGYQSPQKALVLILASYAVSLLSWLTIEQGPRTSVCIALVLYCLCTVLLLVLVYRTVPSERLVGNRPVRMKFSWRIIVWVGLLAFAYGLGDGLTGMGHTTMASKMGMALPALLVALGFVFSKSALNMLFIYRLTLPLMLIGLFASLLPTGWEFVAQMVMSAALVSYQTLSCGIACLSAYVNKSSAIPACGTVLAVNSLCTLLGRYGEQVLYRLGVNELPILVAFFIIAIVASLLLGDQDFASLIVIRERSAMRNRRFESMMRTAGLSKREESIFLLMAEGRSIHDISDELSIAPGTVRAHVSHVYEKFGVHSRQEFDDMVEVGFAFNQQECGK